MIVFDRIRFFFFKLKYKIKNRHNKTSPVNVFDSSRVIIGNQSYGYINIIDHGKTGRLIIGCFCSIADNVRFILSGEHRTGTISSFPFKAMICEVDSEAGSKGDILIDDDVWIGDSVIILSGVHICQGAVIAAGAVVSRDVPPYAIVGGVPAKLIKYRFERETIDFLLTLNYGALKGKMVCDHIDEFYNDIDGLTLEEIERKLGWFPKRK